MGDSGGSFMSERSNFERFSDFSFSFLIARKVSLAIGMVSTCNTLSYGASGSVTATLLAGGGSRGRRGTEVAHRVS